MNRVNLAEKFRNTPKLKRSIGVVFIYIPVLFLPLVLLSAYITLLHLKTIGATNIKPLRDFIPRCLSHRYSLKTQIVVDPAKPSWWSNFFIRSKIFWVFNCTAYCPISVGIYAWHTYLIKIVENFWCPFNHQTKNTYTDGAIDKSFWHLAPENEVKMHPEDRDNPIWNKDRE